VLKKDDLNERKIERKEKFDTSKRLLFESKL